MAFLSKEHRVRAVVLSLALTCLAGASPALAQNETPVIPNGIWIGHPYGMDNYPIKLAIKSDGTCRYQEPRNPEHTLIGTCEWMDGQFLELRYYHLFTGGNNRLWQVGRITKAGFVMT